MSDRCPRCGGQLIQSHEEESCLQCGHEILHLPAPIPVRLTEEQLLIRHAQRQRRWYRRHLPRTRIESRDRARRGRKLLDNNQNNVASWEYKE